MDTGTDFGWGHYLGPASGVSLLARVHKRLHLTTHASFNFTFGDAPLPDYDPTPSVMISLEEMTMGSMKKNEDASARRSVLWMVFAMAKEHQSPEPITMSDDRRFSSILYFLAADFQLSKKRGVVSLASVQARLCYLVDLECGRRTFWSAYCLDNHLSITLGRPRIFHDDDIDQDFPSGVDDDELFTQQPVLRNSHVYSTMLAPVAYFKLYRIMSIVLRDLYSIHPASIVRQYEFAERYSQVLREWRDDIPRFLDADSNGSTPLILIFQRQRDVLNLAYWHAMVLTHRPLLLRNFAKVQCGNHENTTHEPHIERSVRECLDAAMHIVDRMDDMFQSGLMFRSFWGTCYFGFSAAVVLYVYAIQQSFSSSVNTYQTYLDAAIRCQNQLSRITGSGSLVARYCAVLEELRVEALRRCFYGLLRTA
ncbi:hypothetical protein DL95DRAFT_439208 [Leptodontidium sp. 2 PMI_412]|nr:hypothetical protein DL95DRAFT_439208 [Leptodontidium sp. 2 PMI_412]